MGGEKGCGGGLGGLVGLCFHILGLSVCWI